MSDNFEVAPGDLQQMRDWLAKIPYLPQNLGDDFLSCFIRARKGSVERAKHLLDSYYQSRLRHAGYLKNLDPMSSGVQQQMDLCIRVPLPLKSKGGALILVTKMTDSDPNKYEPVEIVRSFAVIFKTLLLDQQVNGGKVVFMFLAGGITLQHLLKWTPPLIASSLNALASCLPSRIEGVHLLNAPRFAEKYLDIVKTLLKPKLASRIFFHSSFETLHKCYPKEILPRDFGGHQKPLDELYAEFRRKVESFRTVMLAEEEELTKLEVLRPKNKTEECVGTFRKLCVD